jgi:hypothetical protein
MRNQRDARGSNENMRHQADLNDNMESYHGQDAHFSISSKRMVDMFLDSRRQQMGKRTDTTTTEAFV